MGMAQLLALKVAEREELSKTLEGMYGKVEERAEAGESTDLTEAERKLADDIEERSKALDEQIVHLRATQVREGESAARLLDILGATDKTESVKDKVEVRAGGARVKDEPRVYNEFGEHSWIVDTVISRGLITGLGGVDPVQARERQERHYREVEVLTRDTTTTSYASLVPPQFLLDEFAPVLRAGRPTANLLRGMPLPPVGMTMTIPRATTGTVVATQATQGTAPTTTDMAVTDLSVPVISFSGRGVISRQSLERGAVNLDRVTFNDLAADAARYLDQQVLFGTGASGNALGMITTSGILAVTQTATTGLDTLKAIANAVQQINTQRFLGADVIVMHPRRWGALTIAVDSSNRPLVTIEAGQLNVFGHGEANLTQQAVGTVLGIPVVTDPNLRTNLGAGTNQDEILVFRRADQYLWEQPGTVREFSLEQPQGPQSIQLAVYGNAAFTAGRYPVSVAYISGIGLVTPTF
jgi:HK97 family phage major capsid protein